MAARVRDGTEHLRGIIARVQEEKRARERQAGFRRDHRPAELSSLPRCACTGDDEKQRETDGFHWPDSPLQDTPPFR